MSRKRCSILPLAVVITALGGSTAAQAKADPVNDASASSVRRYAPQTDLHKAAPRSGPAVLNPAALAEKSTTTGAAAPGADGEQETAASAGSTDTDIQEPPTVGELVRQRTLGFELTGDGVRTSRCQIKLTNKTNKDVKVLIPMFQTFISPDRRFDDVLSTEEKVITVPASGSESMTMQTVCMSTKLQRSPPATLIEYKPDAYPDHAVYTAICAIVERARSLSERGEFEKLGLPSGWNDQTIAQMAIWKFTGSQTPTKADDITFKGVSNDFVSAMGISRNTFNPEQRKSLDQRVNSILGAVDLTLKVLDEAEEEQP